MRVLYLTNMHNPYRDIFFEQLGKECNLTVLFEQRSDVLRDASWFRDIRACNYKEIYLPENELGPLSQTMMKTIDEGWSLIVVGCYNSPKQMIAISYMRRRHLPYVVNSDGMVFDSANRLKQKVRRHVLSGANGYLIAGENCIAGLRREVGWKAPISSYPFSSLTESRISELATVRTTRDASLVLVVSQFLDCKGLDVALDAAARLSERLRWKFVGSGRKADDLRTLVQQKKLSNVEVVPFLKPDDLAREYQHAYLCVLPSRQECWGLVVNEAAACGCPVVSTWGSGAAVDYLVHDFPQYLAEPGSVDSLALAIRTFLARPEEEQADYSSFLRRKASTYTIEGMVESHLSLFGEVVA